MSQPVTPRPSASLILMRDSAEIPYVLMGTRHHSMRFMPGYLVFPGGTVDQDDIDIADSLSVHPETLSGLKRHSNVKDGRAYLWTAIRETVEETGLSLSNQSRWNTTSIDPTARAFGDAGWAPATDKLGLIGRAITPESSPIRFDALFFLASGTNLNGTITPSEELEGVAWLRVDLALAADEMADVTRFMLARALVAWSRSHPYAPCDATLPIYTYGETEVPILRHEDGRIERLRNTGAN